MSTNQDHKHPDLKNHIQLPEPNNMMAAPQKHNWIWAVLIVMVGILIILMGEKGS